MTFQIDAVRENCHEW